MYKETLINVEQAYLKRKLESESKKTGRRKELYVKRKLEHTCVTCGKVKLTVEDNKKNRSNCVKCRKKHRRDYYKYQEKRHLNELN